MGRLSVRAPAALRVLLAGILLAAPGAALAGDAARGEEIARQHCTRCHVVGDMNKFGGIGSTPSFQLLARRDDWEYRFSAFYALRPHPVFVRIPGVPPPTTLPSHVATFELTIEEVADLVAFVREMREAGE